MSDKEGPSSYSGRERRTRVADPEAQFEIDTTRIAERVARERTPLDQIRLREEGEARERIMAAVLEKAAKLFGYNSDHPGEQVVPPQEKTEDAELPMTHAEFLVSIEAQFLDALEALNYLGATTPEMQACAPNWELIKAALTEERLSTAMKLNDPVFLLIPPNSRMEKIRAMQKDSLQGEDAKIKIKDVKNDELWNGDRAKTLPKWRAAIVEGTPDLSLGSELLINNSDLIGAILKECEEEGVSVINDLDAYLTFIVRAACQDKTPDSKNAIVLNSVTITNKTKRVAVARWNGHQLILETVRMDESNNVRLRKMVEVPLVADTFAVYSSKKAEETKETPKKALTLEQKELLLASVFERFNAHPERHQGIEWSRVQERLEAQPEKLWSLNEMERTGGEPDVVGFDKATGEFIFFDCSPESPEGRRNICYDIEGQEVAKKKRYKPKGNAVDMAASMGIKILTELEYYELQKLGKFDLHTASWLQTPDDSREYGAFGGTRDGHAVKVDMAYADAHNDYRAFRGSLRV